MPKKTPFAAAERLAQQNKLNYTHPRNPFLPYLALSIGARFSPRRNFGLTPVLEGELRFFYMHHIVYMSRAVRPLSDQDLQLLLSQCRQDNALHQVTGVLFYSHGNIAQLIEGDPAILGPLYEKIARDGRHSHVTQLINRPIANRSFPDWSMAFHPLETEGFSALEGFFLPDQVPPTPETLTIADAMLVDLVRQAVFGADASPATLPA